MMKEFVERVATESGSAGVDPSKPNLSASADVPEGSSSSTAPEDASTESDTGSSDEGSESGELPLGHLSRTEPPPRKPFTKGASMSDKPSTGYTPEIPRKVVDVPNPISSSRAYTPASSTPDEGKRLVVGKEIALSGEISACDTLVVEGKIEASLTDARMVEVVEGGTFKGEADVQNAIISGTFDGTLKVRDRLEIQATGLVKGTVFYNTIIVESGGRIQGKMDSIDAADK